MSDTEIKLFDKNSIIPEYKALNWDVVINDIPYFVAHFRGYVHTIGGRWGENDLWAWPRNSTPNLSNLLPFNGEPVSWGIDYREENKVNCSEHDWGDDVEVRTSKGVMIKRNGKDFYFVKGDKFYSIPKALTILTEILEGPINFNEIDYKNSVVGKHIFYDNLEARIATPMDSMGRVYIIPWNTDKFPIPPYWATSEFLKDSWYEYEYGMYVDLIECRHKISFVYDYSD